MSGCVSRLLEALLSTLEIEDLSTLEIEDGDPSRKPSHDHESMPSAAVYLHLRC